MLTYPAASAAVPWVIPGRSPGFVALAQTLLNNERKLTYPLV